VPHIRRTRCGDATPLKTQIDVVSKDFRGNRQQDVHEFLGQLLDKVHEELEEDDGKEDDAEMSLEDDSESTTTAAAMEDKKSHERTSLPTDEFFYFKVRQCLECDSCGYSRSKDELYRHLSVDIGEDANKEGWSVGRSLERFFQDEEREVKCEKCETGTTATQTMKIKSW
jgi:ubiquitin C-terminal hydrolase